MSIRIDTLSKVPEGEFLTLMKDFREIDNADIVTAVRDSSGTFTVESTILDSGPRGLITKVGKMSTFGGPGDTGVGPDEPLALFAPGDVAANAELFLAAQPPGTTGLARRLNPDAKYLACRWDYSATPKEFLRRSIVKVTNPHNGRSEAARPVDFGPNKSTGRIADLSPSLARALVLNTNDICVVDIPTPETGVAVGVNLAAIDAQVFPADMTRSLVVMTTSNDTTYWVVNQIGPEEGGQSLMRLVGTNKPEILRSATKLLPIAADDLIPNVVAAELNKAVMDEPPKSDGSGPRPQPNDDVSAKVFAAAQAFVGHSTRNVPGTDHGNLACAWAVNEVVRLALGKPIQADGQGRNGLGTQEVFRALRRHHTQLASANQVRAGTIVISPTPPSGSVHGHIGVVGKNQVGNVGNTPILSNSSTARKFKQNYTFNSWRERYDGKGLPTLFFALNIDQF